MESSLTTVIWDSLLQKLNWWTRIFYETKYSFWSSCLAESFHDYLIVRSAFKDFISVVASKYLESVFQVWKWHPVYCRVTFFVVGSIVVHLWIQISKDRWEIGIQNMLPDQAAELSSKKQIWTRLKWKIFFNVEKEQFSNLEGFVNWVGKEKKNHFVFTSF